MRARHLAAALAGLALVLTGCGGPPVSGEVVKKHYKHGYTTWVPMPAGKVTTLQPVYHPDCYQLTVADENEQKDRTVCADPTTYAEIEVGDHYEEVAE